MPSFIVVSYRFLVHAGKFQTGYDKPPLHTRYVDKTLSGIKAVQTLLAVMHDDTELFKQFMDDRGSGSPADAVDHVVRLVEVVQPCLQAGQHGHQDTVDSGVGHDQPVHVAVGQMVDDLTDRPAAGTVRGVEPAVGEILHQRAQLPRERFDEVDPALVLLRRWLGILAEPFDRVPEPLPVAIILSGVVPNRFSILHGATLSPRDAG